MGVETVTYISDLNASNPVGASDQRSTSDDHIRLIKKALVNTLGYIDGEVSASAAVLNRMTLRSFASYQTGTASATAGAVSAGNYVVLDLAGGADVVTAEDITITASSGRFTVTNAGIYLLQWAMILSASSSDAYSFYTYNDLTSTFIDGPWVYQTALTGSACLHQHVVTVIKSLTASAQTSLRLYSGAAGPTLTRWSGSMTAHRLL